MRKFQLILSYYALFASMGLFIWSIFLGPKPLGFFITAIVIPIAIYFWIILLGLSKIKAVEYPKEAKSQESLAKVTLIVLATIFISNMSILTFTLIDSQLLGNRNSSTPSSKVSSQISLMDQEIEKINEENLENYETILEELDDIKSEISGSNSKSGTDKDSKEKDDGVLGKSDSKVGAITLKSEESSGIVYKEKNTNSNEVGDVEFGKKYTFLDKTDEWYLILFTNGTDTEEGFIKASSVKEVEY